jgi:formylmethanofuran dehydrogenase subunit C
VTADIAAWRVRRADRRGAASPRGLAGKSRAEIERIALGGWNETFAVGALFAVRGEDAGRVVLQGLEGSFLRVGAGLDGGELTVVGQSGDYAGESMTGGVMTVHGNAGDYLGVGMKGGSITARECRRSRFRPRAAARRGGAPS